MRLADVVRKNVAGNLKHYLIYLVSMTTSAMIYFTFVSLSYNDRIREAIQLSESAGTLFNAASGILVFFVAVFVWYSNAFFTRLRKKEIGLYALLGVRKRTIWRMLVMENAAMATLALAGGIVLGILLSKLFFAIVLRMIGSGLSIGFSVSGLAIAHTAVVFAGLALVTSLQSYRIVYRFKLAELFRADNEGELSPRISVLSAIAAALLLAVGYWFSWQPLETSGDLARNWGIFLVCTVLGTIFLFRSLIVLLLRLSQRNRKRHYRGIRLYGTSQLLFRVKSNARLFALIALLSAVTISMLGGLFGQYYTNAIHAAKAQPFSFMYRSTDAATDRQVAEILDRDAEHPLVAHLSIETLQATGDLYDSYEGADDPIRILSAGTYRDIANALGIRGSVALSGDEAAFIRPFYTVTNESDYVGKTYSLRIGGAERTVRVGKLLDERVLGWIYPDLVLVLSDEAYAAAAAKTKPVVYEAYEVEDERSSKAAYEALGALMTDENRFSSYYYTYKSGLEESGLVSFIAAFLGIVFLAATGSVLYFKQLTEAQADRKRYEILRKLGAGRKDIRSTIVRQMLFVFGLPLAVGIVHGLVLLHALTNLISQLIGVNLLVPIAIAVGAYTAIYAGYYALTVVTYARAVNR